MPPKKDIKSLGSVQPNFRMWRVEISGVGKGPSRPTKTLAEQDLEVARAAESRAHMRSILKQLRKPLDASVGHGGEHDIGDMPQAKKLRSAMEEGYGGCGVCSQSQALLALNSYTGECDAEISSQALLASSFSAPGFVAEE